MLRKTTCAEFNSHLPLSQASTDIKSSWDGFWQKESKWEVLAELPLRFVLIVFILSCSALKQNRSQSNLYKHTPNVNIHLKDLIPTYRLMIYFGFLAPHFLSVCLVSLAPLFSTIMFRAYLLFVLKFSAALTAHSMLHYSRRLNTKMKLFWTVLKLFKYTQLIWIVLISVGESVPTRLMHECKGLLQLDPYLLQHHLRRYSRTDFFGGVGGWRLRLCHLVQYWISPNIFWKGHFSP